MDVTEVNWFETLSAADAAGSSRRQSHPSVVGASRPTTPEKTRLLLLGGFQLLCDDALRPLPVHTQRLLAYLGLTERSSRVLAAGTLWPEVSEQRALGNLRSTVWRLQRTCPSVLVASRQQLALAPSVTVDARECRAVASHLTKKPTDPRVGELSTGRLCGELLPGWYDEWVLLERDRLHHLRLHALEEAADSLLGRGHYAEALDAALAAVHSDPLRESARRLMLRIHVAEGNRVEALRHFRSYRVLLAAELGIEPSPRTWALLSPPT
jgi:DNA-binding SARP family transcriptional activator